MPRKIMNMNAMIMIDGEDITVDCEFVHMHDRETATDPSYEEYAVISLDAYHEDGSDYEDAADLEDTEELQAAMAAHCEEED